ncbi:unnamed protein product [Danaus chrysippus]|uniref:(African queen) hypothetical protein n=1 Tax=Danaus chrysippus TaxID=151541 RepID=A0A8J2QWQ8_9NEOP|nr:unnamed protein product [Danaus chrysippus]
MIDIRYLPSDKGVAALLVTSRGLQKHFASLRHSSLAKTAWNRLAVRHLVYQFVASEQKKQWSYYRQFMSSDWAIRLGHMA